MATRKELCEKWQRSDICPNIVKRVQQLCTDSQTCLAYLSGHGEFEIVDGKSTLPVSLNNHTCKFNQWQLTGVPCKHGMRAILYSHFDPLKFVHGWYSVKRYKMTYSHSIKAVPDQQQWPETDFPKIQPPTVKRRPGRPVKNRRRGEGEARKGKRSATLRCGKCGDFGHNQVTCKPTEQEQGNQQQEQPSQSKSNATTKSKAATKPKATTKTNSTTKSKADTKSKSTTNPKATTKSKKSATVQSTNN
ncbi:Zinc finger CCHC domain-containing protein 12 [Bienertia sinuspersici]